MDNTVDHSQLVNVLYDGVDTKYDGGDTNEEEVSSSSANERRRYQEKVRKKRINGGLKEIQGLLPHEYHAKNKQQETMGYIIEKARDYIRHLQGVTTGLIPLTHALPPPQPPSQENYEEITRLSEEVERLKTENLKYTTMLGRAGLPMDVDNALIAIQNMKALATSATAVAQTTVISPQPDKIDSTNSTMNDVSQESSVDFMDNESASKPQTEVKNKTKKVTKRKPTINETILNIESNLEKQQQQQSAIDQSGQSMDSNLMANFQPNMFNDLNLGSGMLGSGVVNQQVPGVAPGMVAQQNVLNSGGLPMLNSTGNMFLSPSIAPQTDNQQNLDSASQPTVPMPTPSPEETPAKTEPDVKAENRTINAPTKSATPVSITSTEQNVQHSQNSDFTTQMSQSQPIIQTSMHPQTSILGHTAPATVIDVQSQPKFTQPPILHNTTTGLNALGGLSTQAAPLPTMAPPAAPGVPGAGGPLQGTLVLHNGQLILLPNDGQQNNTLNSLTNAAGGALNPQPAPGLQAGNIINQNTQGLGNLTLNPAGNAVPAQQAQQQQQQTANFMNQTVNVNTPQGMMTLNTTPSQPNQLPTALILPNGQIVPVVSQAGQNTGQQVQAPGQVLQAPHTKLFQQNTLVGGQGGAGLLMTTSTVMTTQTQPSIRPLGVANTLQTLPLMNQRAPGAATRLPGQIQTLPVIPPFNPSQKVSEVIRNIKPVVSTSGAPIIQQFSNPQNRPVAPGIVKVSGNPQVISTGQPPVMNAPSTASTSGLPQTVAAMLTADGNIILTLPPGGQEKKKQSQRVIMPKPGGTNTNLQVEWLKLLIQLGLCQINITCDTPPVSTHPPKKNRTNTVTSVTTPLSVSVRNDTIQSTSSTSQSGGDILAKATATLFQASPDEISPNLGHLYNPANDDNPLQIDTSHANEEAAHVIDACHSSIAQSSHIQTTTTGAVQILPQASVYDGAQTSDGVSKKGGSKKAAVKQDDHNLQQVAVQPNNHLITNSSASPTKPDLKCTESDGGTDIDDFSDLIRLPDSMRQDSSRNLPPDSTGLDQQLVNSSAISSSSTASSSNVQLMHNVVTSPKKNASPQKSPKKSPAKAKSSTSPARARSGDRGTSDMSSAQNVIHDTNVDSSMSPSDLVSQSSMPVSQFSSFDSTPYNPHLVATSSFSASVSPNPSQPPPLTTYTPPQAPAPPPASQQSPLDFDLHFRLPDPPIVQDQKAPTQSGVESEPNDLLQQSISSVNTSSSDIAFPVDSAASTASPEVGKKKKKKDKKDKKHKHKNKEDKHKAQESGAVNNPQNVVPAPPNQMPVLAAQTPINAPETTLQDPAVNTTEQSPPTKTKKKKSKKDKKDKSRERNRDSNKTAETPQVPNMQHMPMNLGGPPQMITPPSTLGVFMPSVSSPQLSIPISTTATSSAQSNAPIVSTTVISSSVNIPSTTTVEPITSVPSVTETNVTQSSSTVVVENPQIPQRTVENPQIPQRTTRTRARKQRMTSIDENLPTPDPTPVTSNMPQEEQEVKVQQPQTRGRKRSRSRDSDLSILSPTHEPPAKAPSRFSTRRLSSSPTKPAATKKPKPPIAEKSLDVFDFDDDTEDNIPTFTRAPKTPNPRRANVDTDKENKDMMSEDPPQKETSRSRSRGKKKEPNVPRPEDVIPESITFDEMDISEVLDKVEGYGQVLDTDSASPANKAETVAQEEEPAAKKQKPNSEHVITVESEVAEVSSEVVVITPQMPTPLNTSLTISDKDTSQSQTTDTDTQSEAAMSQDLNLNPDQVQKKDKSKRKDKKSKKKNRKDKEKEKQAAALAESQAVAAEIQAAEESQAAAAAEIQAAAENQPSIVPSFDDLGQSNLAVSNMYTPARHISTELAPPQEETDKMQNDSFDRSPLNALEIHEITSPEEPKQISPTKPVEHVPSAERLKARIPKKRIDRTDYQDTPKITQSEIKLPDVSAKNVFDSLPEVLGPNVTSVITSTQKIDNSPSQISEMKSDTTTLTSSTSSEENTEKESPKQSETPVARHSHLVTLARHVAPPKMQDYAVPPSPRPPTQGKNIKNIIQASMKSNNEETKKETKKVEEKKEEPKQPAKLAEKKRLAALEVKESEKKTEPSKDTQELQVPSKDDKEQVPQDKGLSTPPFSPQAHYSQEPLFSPPSIMPPDNLNQDNSPPAPQVPPQPQISPTPISQPQRNTKPKQKQRSPNPSNVRSQSATSQQTVQHPNAADFYGSSYLENSQGSGFSASSRASASSCAMQDKYNFSPGFGAHASMPPGSSQAGANLVPPPPFSINTTTAASTTYNFSLSSSSTATTSASNVSSYGGQGSQEYAGFYPGATGFGQQPPGLNLASFNMPGSDANNQRSGMGSGQEKINSPHPSNAKGAGFNYMQSSEAAINQQRETQRLSHPSKDANACAQNVPPPAHMSSNAQQQSSSNRSRSSSVGRSSQSDSSFYQNQDFANSQAGAGLTSPPLHHHGPPMDQRSSSRGSQRSGYEAPYTAGGSSSQFAGMSSYRGTPYDPPPLTSTATTQNTQQQQQQQPSSSNTQQKSPRSSSGAESNRKSLPSKSSTPQPARAQSAHPSTQTQSKSSKSKSKKNKNVQSAQHQQHYEMDSNAAMHNAAMFDATRSMTPYFPISNLPSPTSRNLQGDGPTYLTNNPLFGNSSRQLSNRESLQGSKNSEHPFMFHSPRGQNGLGFNLQPGFGAAMHGNHHGSSSHNTPHSSAMTHFNNFTFGSFFSEMNNPSQSESLSISPMKMTPGNPLLPSQSGVDHNTALQHQHAAGFYGNRGQMTPSMLHNPAMSFLSHQHAAGFEGRSMSAAGINSSMGPPFGGHGHAASFGMPFLDHH